MYQEKIFRNNISCGYNNRVGKALDRIMNRICKKHRITNPNFYNIYEKAIDTFPMYLKTLVFSVRTKRHYRRIIGALPELVFRFRRAILASGYPDIAKKPMQIIVESNHKYFSVINF